MSLEADDRPDNPSPEAPANVTYLDLVARCDSFPYSFPSGVSDSHRLSRIFVSGVLVGYLRASVVSALGRDFSAYFDISAKLDEDVAFDVCVKNSEDLPILFNDVARFWRRKGTFDVLKGWRDEQYTIYGPNKKVLFTLERAACGLFGLVTYGAHLNVYIPATEFEPIRMWCPRRALTKATYPGMLDNSVAGGISDGLSAYETIIKESGEEASIPESIARQLVKSVGAITYIYVDGTVEDSAGWIQPEVQYIYDMALTGDHTNLRLRPNDGESEDFELWPVHKIKEEMLAGHFKPNCAAVLIDFFIRHGLLVPEEEPDYLRLQQRLHRPFEFPVQ